MNYNSRLLQTLLLLIITFPLFSQYYYNDVVVNKQTNTQYNLLKQAKVKHIKVTSYDPNDQEVNGFSIDQVFNNNWSTLITTSTVATNSASTTTNQYVQNKLSIHTESHSGVKTDGTFQYDTSDNIHTITSISIDSNFQSTLKEVHVWTFKNGKPIQMLKIKNDKDTTKVLFSNDENGNTAEEHWMKNGSEIEAYFYYYNSNKQLTDIVRFNKRVKKYLPDFLFDYDENGNISQMTQVPPNSSNYKIWQYSYNSLGLKDKETCLSKTKELLGKFMYTYEQ